MSRDTTTSPSPALLDDAHTAVDEHGVASAAPPACRMLAAISRSSYAAPRSLQTLALYDTTPATRGSP